MGSRTSMALKNSSKFKIELLKRGLSQVEVARRLEISKQYMCDIVQGRKCPKHLTSRLVEEFGLPEGLFAGLRKAA